MSYYFTKILKHTDFDAAIEQVVASLKNHGFGVLTEIDVSATLKKKIGVDFRKYRILGACNPSFAHKALTAEPHIGVFLPCNVIVQENPQGQIEVSAVDPVASMVAAENASLAPIATDVQKMMQKVIQELEA